MQIHMNRIGNCAQGMLQGMRGFGEDMRTREPAGYRTRLGCAVKETYGVLFDDLSFPASIPVGLWRTCNYAPFFFLVGLLFAEKNADGRYTPLK